MRPRSRKTGLLVQQVGDQVVAYDQIRQRLHVLDRTTSAAWKHCDGRNTEADIAELVGRELGMPADEPLTALALAKLDEAHLLEESAAPSRSDGVSRREVLHWAAAAAAGAFLPTITSCGSPLGPDGVPTAPGGARLTLTVETTTTTPFSTTTTTPFSTTTTSPFSTTTTTPFSTTTTTPFSTTTTTPFSTTTSSTTPFPSTTTSTTPLPTTTTTTAAPSRKVQICHKGRSIMVDENAVPDHLSHGDTLGPCP